MIIDRDPVGELVLLCKAAAEAGEDWRTRLRGEWVPRWLSGASGTALGEALHEWTEEEGTEVELGSALERAVIAALSDDGYD
jgi:hypothetical protein